MAGIGPASASGTARLAFAETESAIETVIATLQLGIPIARAEFLVEMSMKAVSSHSSVDYAAAPTLFFEFHGSSAGVEEDAANVRALATERGAVDIRSAVEADARTKLWRARHDHFYLSLALRSGSLG